MIEILLGPNMYEVGQQLNTYIASFRSAHPSGEVKTVDVTDSTRQDLDQMLQGVSLFSEWQMLILKGVGQQAEIAARLTELISSGAQYDVVAIEQKLDKRSALYKAAKKHDRVHEFPMPQGSFLREWVEAQIAQLGGTSSSNAASALIARVGNDQLSLYQEIQKLVLYNKYVSRETVELLVASAIEESTFELLDAVASSDTRRSLMLLDQYRAGHTDPFSILSLLGWHVQVLAVTKLAGDRSDTTIASDHSLNPYVIKKARQLSRGMSLTDLRQLLGSIAEADIRLKSTSTDPWSVLESIVMNQQAVMQSSS